MMRLYVAILLSITTYVIVSGFQTNSIVKRSIAVIKPSYTLSKISSSIKHSSIALNAEKPRKITRDSEEEFFETDFDRKPLNERLPAALGFLAAVSLPFIVGLVYLYSNK